MTTPTASSSGPTTGQLLQALVEEMQGMNNRMEMLINMFQSLADQVEGHSAAIATYFQQAAEAAEQAATRAAAASAAITTNIGNAGTSHDVKIVETTTITHGFDATTSKHTITVLCGEWQKFGVPVYPEYLKRLGFETVNDIPMGTTPWEKTVVVQMGESKMNPGQIVPKRVIGLAN